MRFYVLEHCSNAPYEFQAHAAIVVWAFPEASMVVIEVYTIILVDTPVPFAMLMVDESVLDVLP
jgi:hypothetical protein